MNVDLSSTVLAAPVLSASSPSYDSIVVSWGAVHMAVGFSVSIMRSDGLGNMVKENTTNTSLVFTSLDSGTLYTIKAHAWNVNGIPGDDFIYNQRTSKYYLIFSVKAQLKIFIVVFAFAFLTDHIGGDPELV